MTSENIEEPQEQEVEEVTETEVSTESEVEDKPIEELTDDEKILRGDDTVINTREGSGDFLQAEGTVYYLIDNLYTGDGKLRTRLAMRNDPPVLHVGSSASDSPEEYETHFLLTPELTNRLNEALDVVNRQYRGLRQKSDEPSIFTQEGFQERMRAALEWVKDHKVLTGVLTALIVYAIYVSFAF